MNNIFEQFRGPNEESRDVTVTLTPEQWSKLEKALEKRVIGMEIGMNTLDIKDFVIYQVMTARSLENSEGDTAR